MARKFLSRKFLAFVVLVAAAVANGVFGADIDVNTLWKAVAVYVPSEGLADLISRTKDALETVKDSFPQLSGPEGPERHVQERPARINSPEVEHK